MVATLAPIPKTSVNIDIQKVFLIIPSVKSVATNVKAITTIETATIVFDAPKSLANILINIEFAMKVNVFVIISC
ncbi:MAG: hypothetical protein RR525_11360 [Cellulosilyticaceae bacterium]